MSCKCEKIMKLYKELDYLQDIEDALDELVKKHHEVCEDLNDLSHVVPVTLKVPDESKLSKDIYQLNKDTATGINAMYKHLDTAIAKVEKLLQKAIKEDDAFHKGRKKQHVMIARCRDVVAVGMNHADTREMMAL